MEMDKQNRGREHVWVAVVVAIAALGCGVLIGSLSGRRGPSAQSIADGLSIPLPVPDGAKLLKLFGPDTINAKVIIIDGGYVSGYVSWRTGIALDITGMAPAQVEVIPKFYESFFDRACPDIPKCGYWSSDYTGATRGFTRFVTGQAPPEGWTIAAGGRWTWGMRAHAVTSNLFCEVDAEVMDFDHLGNSALWEHKGVLDLNAPVKGQRVMYVKLTFQGQGVGGSGSVKWAPKPLGYTLAS